MKYEKIHTRYGPVLPAAVIFRLRRAAARRRRAGRGHMFEKDALVVYGRTGVCRVLDVTVPDFCRTAPGERGTLYYVLRPLYQDRIIYAPADNPQLPLRPILTEEEALALVDLIPSVQAKAYYGVSVQDLRDHYQSMLQTNRCADLMEMVLSIYAKKARAEQTHKKFGAVDERFMRQAEALFAGEIAASLGITPEEVPDYIARRVHAAQADGAAREAEPAEA